MESNLKKRSDTVIYKNIKVPEELVEIVKEKLGDEYLWNYNEDTNEIFVIKRPESITEALYGLGAEMWKKSGGTKYLEQERNQWDV